MTAQKAILPGMILGIFILLGLTSLMRAVPIKGAANENSRSPASLSLKNSAANRANNPGCSISSSYPDSIQQWCSIIERYGRENGLDPNLISAVMLQESAGRADAYSKSGAVGLLQVMPRDGKAADFMCPAGPCFADRPSTQELFEPNYNIAYGTKMLAQLIDHFGDVREALKAYGPKDVGYYYADIILGILNSHQ